MTTPFRAIANAAARWLGRLASSSAFRSLRIRNFRLWAAGAFLSNVGTWMQRTAQDWLVLTDLTDRNATALGIVMALQFGPSLVLLPLTGLAADHLDRRKLLLATQAAMGVLALALGLLTVSGCGPALACVRLRAAARLRHRVRRAGTPDLRVRTGRQRRPARMRSGSTRPRSSPRG